MFSSLANRNMSDGLLVGLSPSLFDGDSFLSTSNIHVHLHILFPVQDWNADVLLIHTKTNKLCQLAYDMLVSIFLFQLLF